ncbi:MAG: acyl-CoA synthetase FdrA [Pisciglobus halotolerans]|nr:acyl-CoA synthetase FdrA [Pisciglobus halotolerans]
MIYTKIKENGYQDSINLMLLTNAVSTIDGVEKAQVMMGTDANKDILKEAGLYNEEVESAQPSDMVVAVDSENKDVLSDVMDEVEHFLSDLSVKKEGNEVKDVHTWDEALNSKPDANMALISVPGVYAADEIETALDNNLHAFVFSDNVAKEDEVRLKKKAHDKGLLVMGPDCGTGIISNVPMAFTNVVRPGNIGIVGASGTGIQEVTTIIERLGGGVIHAIGTGGRDLSDEVGAITMKDSLVGLAEHEPTDVIVVISKPPAPEVRDDVVRMLHDLPKPVVAIFLGENPDHYEGDVYLAHTLEETANIAVDLANGKQVKESYPATPKHEGNEKVDSSKTVKGLYSGGTLASEAAMLISEALELGGLIKEEGYILKTNGFDVMDLGDDIYTQGKPHPMIDPEVRKNKIREYAADKNTGIILLDVVLGYGSHPDMAGALAPVIKESIEKAKSENRELYFVGTVCGTTNDPQNYDEQKRILEEAGVLVEDSNAKAVRLALHLMGKDLKDAPKKDVPYTKEKRELPKASDAVVDLLNTQPRVINIGVESFSQAIREQGGEAVQYNWKPVAGGNRKLIKILNQLKQMDEIDEQNERVIGKFRDAQPFLVDVVPAHTVIPELKDKVLLHAGPSLSYDEMTGPMQGSCIGATLYEGWADTEEEAKKMLENGEFTFIPCHHVNAVGPMGGITSKSMPVFVVENRLTNNKSYCIMNEGIGKVLRFGAYSQEVVDRLTWMQDVLGPVLGKALRKIKDGLNVNVLIAKAITMGDEFHQRNIAASLLFLKEISPTILSLEDVENDTKQEVIQFLADTDQFFLNIMMATGKSIVDGARKEKEGTIVTTLTRNGKDFGVRVSGLGDQWFKAPVNTPKGLYFTGFSEEDGNKDIGDSAITETVGVGGMAMIAAPGVTRFVGAGGFDDALKVSDEMSQICVTHNPNWSIPTWDFKGACLGIDIRKVVETGITPIINTGIANKVAGLGQVGAGTVRAPLACFEQALEAYAESVGIEVGED